MQSYLMQSACFVESILRFSSHIQSDVGIARLDLMNLSASETRLLFVRERVNKPNWEEGIFRIDQTKKEETLGIGWFRATRTPDSGLLGAGNSREARPGLYPARPWPAPEAAHR